MFFLFIVWIYDKYPIFVRQISLYSFMKKNITLFVLATIVTLTFSACGSSKHGSKCDAYSSVESTKGDLASK
jgi:hypothetical protein